MQSIEKKAGGVVYVTAKNNLTEFIPGHFPLCLGFLFCRKEEGLMGGLKRMVTLVINLPCSSLLSHLI